MTINDDSLLEPQKVYDVNHDRKGKFKIKVIDDVNGTVEGYIVEGHIVGLSSLNEWFEGDRISVRKSLCTFTLVDGE